MDLRRLVAPLMKRRLVNADNSTVDISALTADSRQVVPGSLFVAIRGYTVDGHSFVSDSVAKGAAAVLVEEEQSGVSVPQIVVPDTRFASAVLASVFYGHPSRQLRMIGVTGTNGKTTTTHLIETVLQGSGFATGLYGTIGKRIAGKTVEAVNTTPEAVELQEMLHEMVEHGCTYGIMEVSSHALELRRVAGTRYHIAVFTNLTQDHLDFHGTMDNYRAAKGKLFSRLGNEFADDASETQYAVLNADDPASTYMAEQTAVETISYGIDAATCDVRATDVQIRANGVCFQLNTFKGNAPVSLQLTGRFNVYNALAAVAVGLIEGIPLSDIVRSLESVPGIPGRLESVEAGKVTVLVDYSHTPDSLKNALLTVREFAERRVISVVGCGGDRDTTKRPIMARIAAENSDLTILTSDNPRTEDPERILDDMEAGIAGTSLQYRRILDRRAAIEQAIADAGPGDVVLIAGKGHETYQIIGTAKQHFDDREVAREAIKRLSE